MTYTHVQRWLTERMSFDASLLQGAGFDSLIAERMAALQCGNEDNYVETLDVSEEEAERLAGSIAVPETWFFRYPQSFQLLCEHLQRRLREGATALRMVSVGCASGEEAYGMAMAALHAGWAKDRVLIHALDRSEAAIRRGKVAEYGSFSIRHEVPAWALEFLQHESGRVFVDDQVRAMVQFKRANVLNKRAFEAGSPYDVAFCRNLLIYLDAEAREKVLASITDSLVEGGLLFMGHAEQMLAVTPQMKRIDSSHAFALERVGLKASKTPTRAATPAHPRATASAPFPSTSDPKSSPVAPRASRPLASTQSAGPTKSPTLEDALELADAGRNQESEELIRSIIAGKGPTAAALELLGTLRQASNDGPGAKALFEQALYLEPTRTTSLVQLALIHERSGENAKAERLWERVKRAGPAGNERGAP